MKLQEVAGNFNKCSAYLPLVTFQEKIIIFTSPPFRLGVGLLSLVNLYYCLKQMQLNLSAIHYGKINSKTILFVTFCLPFAEQHYFYDRSISYFSNNFLRSPTVSKPHQKDSVTDLKILEKVGS